MPEMDDSGRHEVSHMASFLSRAVASELCEHAQVQANPEWKALADSAAESLWRSIRRPAGHILETMAPYPGNKRSEEHTSELQSLMRNSYAVFCLKNKK